MEMKDYQRGGQGLENLPVLPSPPLSPTSDQGSPNLSNQSFASFYHPSISVDEQQLAVLRSAGMDLPCHVKTALVPIPESIHSRRGLSAVVVGANSVIIVGGYTKVATGNEWRPSAVLLTEGEDGLTYTSAQSEVRVNIGGPLTADSHHSHTAVLVDSYVYVFGGLGYTHSVHGIVWDHGLYAIHAHTLKVTDLSATVPREIQRRRGHTAVVYEKTMFVYGGWGARCDDWIRTLDVYNTMSRKWQQPKKIRCGFPPGVAHHTAVVAKGTMFVFGGLGDYSTTNTQSEENAQLDLKPRHLKNILAVFGNSKSTAAAQGYHIPCGVDVAGKTSRYEAHLGEGSDTLLCTNALFTYVFSTRQWKHQQTVGEVPPPRCHHTAAIYDELHMIVTGGEGEMIYNDLYILNVVVLVWCRVDFETAPRPLGGHATPIIGGKLYWVGGTSSSVYSHARTNRKNPIPRTEVIPVQKALTYINLKRHYFLVQLKASEGEVKPKIILRRKSSIRRQVCRMMITRLTKFDVPNPKSPLSKSSSSERAPSPPPKDTPTPSRPSSVLARCVTSAQSAEAIRRLYTPEFTTLRSQKLSSRYPNLKPVEMQRPLTGSKLQQNQERLYYNEVNQQRAHNKDLMKKYVKDNKPLSMDPKDIDDMTGRLYQKGKDHETAVTNALTKKYYHGTERQLTSQQSKKMFHSKELASFVKKLSIRAQEEHEKERELVKKRYFDDCKPQFHTNTNAEMDAIFKSLYEEGMLKKQTPNSKCKHS